MGEDKQVGAFLKALKEIMLQHGIKSIESADNDGCSVGIVINEDNPRWTEFAWEDSSIRPENL